MLMIKEHLRLFKKLFPANNVTPKQHCTLHFPTLIKKNGPLIWSSCFNSESTRDYYKILARQQNFKNVPLSLTKHQNLESCNFLNSDLVARGHPIFSIERNMVYLKLSKK